MASQSAAAPSRLCVRGSPLSKSALYAGVAVCAFSADLAAARDGLVQLMPAGVFKGRDGRGPYQLADPEKFIADTQAYCGGMDLVVDYNHQTDFAAKDGVGGRAPAAGWIKPDSLVVIDGGVWGRVEWTPAAQAQVDAKEFRYLSPVYSHAKTGSPKRVGWLMRAALVNSPNLELAAVAAQQPPEGKMDKEKLILALGLKPDATEADIEAAINAATGAADQLKAVAQAAGLKADAAGTEIVVAVQSAKAGGAPDPTKWVPAEQVVSLQTQLNELKGDRAKDKAEAAVDAAIKAGKLIPALRDWAIGAHAADPAKFETDFLAKAPVVLRSGPALTEQPEGDSSVLTDGEKAICATMGWDEAAFLATKKAEA